MAPLPRSRGRRRRAPAAQAALSLFVGVLLGAASVACGHRAAAVDPVLPDAVDGLRRTGELPDETAGTWAFPASIETRRAHYAAPDGPGLTIHAFLFTTPTVASDTYETSRRNIRSGGGGFTSAREGRVAGVRGMRLADASGEHFVFQRGCWVIALEGPAERFAPALRGIRWEEADARR